MNRTLGEGFVIDINGIGNALLCNVKYTKVWGNQTNKKHFHWENHSFNSWARV